MRDGTETRGDGTEGEVVFDHVSFRYPGGDGYVLEDISFTAHKGETVAFIGATGSGKSSLVNLIPRLYDVSEGSVRVDGVDVRDYDREALRNKLGYVSQKAVLFAGDIRGNITLGENGKGPEDNETVDKALSIAQASEFVDNLLDGRKRPRSPRAAPTSPAARNSGSPSPGRSPANPEIYIFDDSFSALDYKTDRVLRERLKTETAGVTTLIVAQRIGTIMDADRIVVLDDGQGRRHRNPQRAA